MIYVGYFNGANRELEGKTNIKHGSKYLNSKLNEIIKSILDSGLNIMIKQRNEDNLCKNYLIYIDDGNFKQR